jgi:hypothetical protein
MAGGENYGSWATIKRLGLKTIVPQKCLKLFVLGTSNAGAMHESGN